MPQRRRLNVWFWLRLLNKSESAAILLSAIGYSGVFRFRLNLLRRYCDIDLVGWVFAALVRPSWAAGAVLRCVRPAF